MEKKPRKVRQGCLFLLVLIFGGCVGGYIGGWLGGKIDFTSRIPWQSVGTPPGKGAHLLGINYPYGVIVQSTNQKVYACCQYQMDAWQEEGPNPLQHPSKTSARCDFSVYPYIHVAPAPSGIRECLNTNASIEGQNINYYALREDGSIWWWHFESGLFLLNPYAFYGLGIGIFLGAGSAGTLRWKSTHRKEKEEAGEANESQN
jgi:hypothetical protein